MEEPGENKSSESPSDDVSTTGTQTPDVQPSVAPGPVLQPSILQLGGLQSYLILAAGQPVTALRGAGLNVVPLGNNLSILQTNGLHLPVLQPEGLQTPTGQSARATTSQSMSLQPQIFQIGGLQPSTVQLGSSVQSVGLKPQSYQLSGLQSSAVQIGSSSQSARLQTQSSFGFQPSTVHVGPTGQSIQLLPQTFQPARYQTQSTIPSEVQSHGLIPVSYELTAPTTSVKQGTEDARKKVAKSRSETVTHVDVSCTAYSIPKVKHASTNTAKVNKSIGTQANISLRSRSQAVQCPEGAYSNLRIPQMLQENSTQVEPTTLSTASQDGDPSLQRNVMFVQDSGTVGNVLTAYEAWQADKLFLQDFQRIQRHRYVSYEPGQVQFDDVAIYFSKDEWRYLKEEDKDLYMQMMVKNYRTLQSLGWITVKPPLISMIEQGEDLYAKYPKPSGNPHIPQLARRDSTSLKTVNSMKESYDLHAFSERLRKSIDYFLTLCIQQTEDLLSGTTVDFDAQAEHGLSGPFCQINPLLGQKPALDERPFRCLRCDRRFKRFCDLVAHLKFHPFENGFSCFQCNMKFRTPKTLTKHELTHTGEKPFICPRCGKRFFTQHLLDNHLGVTLKKNPFVCSECGKRFPKKYSLRKHEMVHNRSKPFLCSICGKGFTEEEEFNEHQRIHMEEHVYICDFCGKRFSSKQSYDRHQQEHVCSQQPDFEQQGQLLLLKQIQEGEPILPKELQLHT